MHSQRRRILSMLLLALSLTAACSGLTQPSSSAPSEALEVDLQLRLRDGMRFVQQVTMIVKGSGAGLGRESRQAQRQTQSREMTISNVTADTYDARIAVNGTPIPATSTFSKDWTILNIRMDDPNVMSGVDQAQLQAALQRLQKVMKQSSQFFGRWTVGEQRPTNLLFPVPNGQEVLFKFATTFRRVTMIQDRNAGEFEFDGGSDLVISGRKARVDLNGRSWIDLVTGIPLRASARGRVDMQLPAGPVRIDFEQEETLDLASSRL